MVKLVGLALFVKGNAHPRPGVIDSPVNLLHSIGMN
jgi:hypothetical protein